MIFVENFRYKRDGIYCGRRNTTYKLTSSPLANPYHLGAGETREAAVAKYNVWLQARLHRDTPQEREIQRLLALVLDIGTITLLCWCAPAKCHCDAIKAEIEMRLTS